MKFTEPDDETCNSLLYELDEIARGACQYEYGLPMSEPEVLRMREAILRWYKSVSESDGHDSDCATHNEPAYPSGLCDCKVK